MRVYRAMNNVVGRASTVIFMRLPPYTRGACRNIRFSIKKTRKWSVARGNVGGGQCEKRRRREVPPSILAYQTGPLRGR